MKVLYGEGHAHHTGPEPCADDLEVGGEASVGGGIGQVLSREISSPRAPTMFQSRKAIRTVATMTRGRSGPARSETLACAQAPRAGSGRSLVHPGHVTGVGPHTTVRGSTSPSPPEAGAVCGNSARTDLCGGRSVMSVPTAFREIESDQTSREDAYRFGNPPARPAQPHSRAAKGDDRPPAAGSIAPPFLRATIARQPQGR